MKAPTLVGDGVDWGIAFSRKPSGAYEICLRYPGARGGCDRFVRRLPPDFSDFLLPSATGRPKRTWRRAPGDKLDDALLFCAADLETLKEIGARLHEALFKKPRRAGGDLTGEFLALREASALRGEGFDIRIDLTNAPQLARVPWEALYLAADDLFLGIDAKSNIVRILAPDHPGPLPPAVEPPIRMLVAVANPTGELETGAELADIRRRLDQLLDASSTRYQLRTLPAATRSEFARQVEEWKPHVVHFIGHGGFGDERGLIYFHHERDAARRDPVDSATLRDLVRNDRPWLIVLNSCLGGAAARADPFGGAAQNLTRINVPFVVAMQSPISDEAAVRFSQRFYASLMRGDPVATAVTRGRNAIRSLGEESLRAELITPVLYTTGVAEAIEMAEPPPAPAPEAPPLPPPGLWTRRIAPALPTLNHLAGILGALVAVVTLYMMVESGGDGSAERSASKVGAASDAAGSVAMDLRKAEKGASRGRGESRLPVMEQELEGWAGPSATAGPAKAQTAEVARSYRLLPPRPQERSIGSSARAGSRDYAAVRVPVRNGAPRGATVTSPPASATQPGQESVRIRGAVRQHEVLIPRLGALIATAVGSSSYAQVRVGPAEYGAETPEAGQQGNARTEEASRRRARIGALLAGRSGVADDDEPYSSTDPMRAIQYAYEMWRAPAGQRRAAVGGTYAEVGLNQLLIFPVGSWNLTDSSAAKLESTALSARNGAGLQLRAVGEGEERARELTERRLASALDFLLSRGVDPSLLSVAPDSPLDPGVASYLSLLGSSSFVQIQSDGSAAAETRRARRPVSVVATFPFQSVEPLAEDLFRYPGLLTSPAGADLALALTGHADPEEAAASGALGEKRARYVADRLRALRVPEAALQVAAAPVRADAANPLVERKVEGRLVLRGVERVPPASEPAAGSAEAAALDRLAGWLQRHRQFGVHVGGTGEAAPDEASGAPAAAQAERLRTELRQRGIEDERIFAAPRPAPLPPDESVEISIVPLR